MKWNNSSLYFYVILWVLVTVITVYIVDRDSRFTLFDFGQSVLGGTLAALAIHYINNTYLFWRNHPSALWKALLQRTVMYALILAILILAVGIPSRALENDKTISEVIRGELFVQFLLGGRYLVFIILLLAGSFVINLLSEVRLILGPTVLKNLFLGKYQVPTKEDRIFMFLDLKDSTPAAEELGDIEFLNFKKDFFDDLAEPILSTKGEIYQYVGDEAIITWPLNKDDRLHTEHLQCFYEFQETLNERAEIYKNKYNRIPEFKAGVHCGQVISAELGTVKKDITYSGDTLNVAARLEALCNQLGKTIIMSDELANRTNFSTGMLPDDLGVHKLMGKKEKMRLFSVKV